MKPGRELDYRHGRELLGPSWPVTLAQHRACLFLARHGQRFLCDFGTVNAPEKAQQLRRELKVKAQRTARRKKR